MPTPTDNFNLNRPDEGTKEWHVPLNDNFTKIDELLASDSNSATTMNGVQANDFDGAGLASKVNNALQWLADNFDGRGVVRVTPKDDGTAWNWDTELTIDDSVHHGVQLIIDENVSIDYGGSGVAITIEGEIAERRPQIIGGLWTFSGDPTGWLRLKDCYGCVVSPTQVVDVENSAGDAFGVSIENHDDWAEHSKLRDCRITGDRCVQFLTASETGGSGTPSFQETKIENCHFKGNDWCVRTKGNFKYSSIVQTTFRPKADGANCLWFDHDRATGMTCRDIKFENAGAQINDDTGIYDPNNASFYGPLVINAAFYRMTNDFEGGSSLHNLTFYGGNGFQFDRPTGGANIAVGEGEVAFGGDGARIYLDSSGKLVAVDENDNESTLT